MNEQESLPFLKDRLLKVLESLNLSWEVIFVDDGSTDHSLEILKKYSLDNKNIKVISFTRNFGHQAALSAGLDLAKGEASITMDCDLQDPPELIPEFIARWKEGYKIVYGRRSYRKDGFFKRITAKCYYKLLYKFSDIKIRGNIADYRLLDRVALDNLKEMKERSRYLRGMVPWLGYKYAVVDYMRPKRKYGKTGFSLLKMVRFGMSGILSFSLLPLRLGLVLGLITIPIGLFFLLYISLDAIINHVEYPLYKWLAVVNFIFVGFLFVLVWILGEYIGKAYEESRGRPLYIINETENI
jgi:dolichol-phosphate mannosyltransferase